ncbi:DM13 domain-containing protein [Vulcanococcus limneticus]|uniref:DM13 domain-containing protein n=1 Tax=Vulcanococcus limneticus TaxID=2170428 RepID=UPI00398BE779
MTVVSKSLISGLTLAILAASAVGVHAQDKMAPGGAMKPPGGAMMAPAAVSSQGTFRKAEAPVSGGFVIKNEGGKQVLVLSSDFKTKAEAPDLKVAFSTSSTPLAASKPPAYPLKPGSTTVLAPLKSPSGSQSYVIPASLNLAKQGSLLIWCQQFNATMAWAPLKG